MTCALLPGPQALLPAQAQLLHHWVQQGKLTGPAVHAAKSRRGVGGRCLLAGYSKGVPRVRGGAGWVL